MQTTRVQRCSTCVICAQSSSSKSRTSSVTCGFTRGKDRLHATCVTDRLPRYATTETFLYFFCARSLCAHSVCAQSRCDYPFGAIHFTGKTRYKRDMQREREREGDSIGILFPLMLFSRLPLSHVPHNALYFRLPCSRRTNDCTRRRSRTDAMSAGRR